MTREQYLQLRVKGNFIAIVYMFFIEKSMTTLPYPMFKSLFNQWMLREQYKNEMIENMISTEQIFDFILDGAISYFDGKFKIVYIIIEKENKTKEKTTIIL